MVILQADVTTDGTVRDARVLRGVATLTPRPLTPFAAGASSPPARTAGRIR